MIRCERATIERAGRVVVEALTVTFATGESTAVVGPTGAGKSSLMAACAAALPLHAGEILVEGHPIRHEADAVRRLVGYVPDRLPLWPGMRAGEFLEVFAAAVPAHGREAAVARALAMAGLSAEPSTPLEALAAGQQKRLLLARALLHDPSVLVLDDPFGGLDALEREHVERLISDTHLMGRTVVAAIDSGHVPSCFTRLVALREGRLVAEGPATPAAFGDGRRWRCAIVCRGAADAAVAVLTRRGVEAWPVDADLVAFRVAGPRPSPGAAVAGLVEAGINVEWAGFHPPWPMQLFQDDAIER